MAVIALSFLVICFAAAIVLEFGYSRPLKEKAEKIYPRFTKTELEELSDFVAKGCACYSINLADDIGKIKKYSRLGILQQSKKYPEVFLINALGIEVVWKYRKKGV